MVITRDRELPLFGREELLAFQCVGAVYGTVLLRDKIFVVEWAAIKLRKPRGMAAFIENEIGFRGPRSQALVECPYGILVFLPIGFNGDGHPVA